LIPLLAKPRTRDILIVVVSVLSVAAYALAARSAAGESGFPLDDSWIHQTYGRNLAYTGRWAYVPGVPSAGSTSPFYTVLLAIGYVLRVPFFFWTYALGAVALALAGLVGVRMSERLYPSINQVGLWTGLTVVLTWHLIWAAASGMETMLFATISLIVIDLAWWASTPDPSSASRREKSPLSLNIPLPEGEGIRVRVGFLFGLASAILIATRPEGVLLVGLTGAFVLLAWFGQWRQFVMWCGGALIGGLIGIAPYLLLNLSLNGTILPNTFSAKQAENVELLAQPFVVNLWAMTQPLTAGGQLLLLPGAVVTFVKLMRQIRTDRRAVLYIVPIVWAVVLLVLYAARLPAYYQHGRYVIPALAPFLVFSVGGLVSLVTLAAQRRAAPMSRVLARTLAVTAIAIFPVFWLIGLQVFATDVKMIHSDMVVASRWLAQNVPPEHLLAVHDIGAVGYFAPRPMLDLAGLVSPEVIPIIRDPIALMKLMQAQGVRYLMVLPPQRPALADDPRLCERFNARGGMGGMTIYEMAWDGHCPNR
jgi:hypothetical protein